MRSQLWLLAASGHLASADWLFGQELDARGVVGLSWPRATGASTHDGANGWTPRPTEAAYVAGGAGALELARRRDQRVREKRAQTTANTWENAQTCGWRAGTESIPFTCADSSSCATNSDSVVGCTSSGGTDPFFTVCLDYQAFKNGACNSIGPKTGCCETASIGSCITYIWTGTAPKSMYRCYTAQAIITMLDEPQVSQTTKASSSSTSSSTSASTTSSSTTSSPAAESTTGTPAPASSGSSNNTGAIVGGVVGGVAGIALIAGAIAYLVIRNRNKNRTPGAGTAYSAVAPGDTSYPGGAGGPMPPSTYAPSSLSPHMSQAGGYFPPPSSTGGGGGLHPDTPYMAGATPPVPGPGGAYNPHAPYYDPAKLAEQQQMQQQYGGYAPYPGQQQQQQQHQVVSELDPTSVAPGHQSNPVEMASNPPGER